MIFFSLLVLFFWTISHSHAQIPTYGNLQAQEYGDAVYRQIANDWLNFFGADYNHTAVYAGMNSSHVTKVMAATGEASSSGGDTTAEVDFSDINNRSGLSYYGAYTKSDLTISFTGRKSVVATAVSIVDTYIPYVAFDAINFYAGGRSVGYISEIRCDAVVEYAYEANGYAVWWWAGYPNDWSILSFPADHNDAPTPPSDPSYEFSPWAQRGAPGHSPTYNTFLTRPSVINLPTYQVTTNGGPGYLDVTVQAKDESGIHFIGVVKPGEASWTYSPTQPQHPTSDSYSWTVRITNSGTLYYAALDNGGNAPSAAQTPSVTITVPPPDTTRPTITITNPAANARFTNNAAVTVQGTAADNLQVAAVNYQLNGGGWNIATGTTNWQTSVTLVQGTNVFQAFSVDTAGNNSPTNSRTNILVLTAPIVVQTNGVGTVSPNFNGQMLEIGKSYSMTATAGTGFKFTNWTGSLITNAATLNFTMVSNLTFTAIFIDTNKPTFSITNLTTGQRISNSVFTVKGTAIDNWQIGGVQYQLNGGALSNATTANNWTNWAADLVLVPGTNVFLAYAMDTSGNNSVTNSVNFIFVVTNQLQLFITGLGSITPSNTWLEIGRNYSITSAPAAGFRFTNWTGSVTAYTAALNFTMASNLSFTANFVDTNKPTLSITNLVAGQRWSNAVFTVRGTASDNWQVASVQYQLNGLTWSNATTTNAWTNWFATLNLVPGTNTVAAYATDNTGYVSATTNLSFQYVVTNQLQIRTSGKGTISPNYSNAWLEIGRNYSITSAPAAGFVFTNWTVSTNWIGGATVTGTNLLLMMQSNLTLLATFIETSRPTLTITAPTNNQKMTNALMTGIGTANDNWQISNIWYQLNSNSWNPAMTTNSFTNWRTPLMTLVIGTNTLKAYALNLGGNYSPTSSVSFVSSNTFALQLVFTNAQPIKTNGLVFNLQLSTGLNGRIQVSTNLIDWASLTNFVGTNSTITFRDPAATNSNQRFYRAVIP